MQKLLQRLKKFHPYYERVAFFLGPVLVILILLTFLYPNNGLLMAAAFAAGGLIYVLNGLKTVSHKNRRNMSISYIFFGILIILIGILTSRYI